MSSNLVRGKVARVLNAREVALNIGAKDGVRAGMYFDILDSKGEDIVDPDTKRVLGSLSRRKVRLVISSVQENLSVASTYKKSEVRLGTTGPSIKSLSSNLNWLALFSDSKTVTRYETLKIPEHAIEDLDEKNSYVKVGDVAVEAVDVQVEDARELES